MMDHILTNIIFIPLFAAIILGVFRANITYVKVGAMLSSVVTLFLVGLVTMSFDPNDGMQFTQNIAWIKNSGISYYVGVDFLLPQIHGTQ